MASLLTDEKSMKDQFTIETGEYASRKEDVPVSLCAVRVQGVRPSCFAHKI
jgi:hypothetical protein